MRRTVLGLLGLLALAPLVWAEQPKEEKPNTPTPEAEYQALVKEFNDAEQEFYRLYRAAKTEQERDQLVSEKRPNPDKYGDRFIALAAKYPKDPVAADALIWVLTNSRGYDAKAEKRQAKVIDTLITDHINHKKIGEACQQLVYSQSPAVEKLMRATLEKSPDRTVGAQACLSLAQYLKNLREAVREIKADAETAKRWEQYYGKDFVKQLQQRDGDQLAKESEQLFQRVIDKYGDLKRYPNIPGEYGKITFGKAAEGELFEIRHLAIGKTAPDIEGEDLDAKKFKLSDYKGKVVVIDFWGNW